MMFMTEPQPSDGFEWTQAPWGPVLRCQPLLEVAPHFFTAASLQLREDATEWEAVARSLACPADRVRLIRQVHGATSPSSRAAAATVGTIPEADGVISDDPSAALAVRVADCAPILMADRRRGVAAAVHAGWREHACSASSPRPWPASVASSDTNPADLIVGDRPLPRALLRRNG